MWPVEPLVEPLNEAQPVWDLSGCCGCWLALCLLFGRDPHRVKISPADASILFTTKEIVWTQKEKGKISSSWGWIGRRSNTWELSGYLYLSPALFNERATRGAFITSPALSRAFWSKLHLITPCSKVSFASIELQSFTACGAWFVQVKRAVLRPTLSRQFGNTGCCTSKRVPATLSTESLKNPGLQNLSRFLIIRVANFAEHVQSDCIGRIHTGSYSFSYITILHAKKGQRFVEIVSSILTLRQLDDLQWLSYPMTYRVRRAL